MCLKFTYVQVYRPGNGGEMRTKIDVVAWIMPSGCTTMLLGSRLRVPYALMAPGMASFVGPVVTVVTPPLVAMVGASEMTALKLKPNGVTGHDDDGDGVVAEEAGDEIGALAGAGLGIGAGVGNDASAGEGI